MPKSNYRILTREEHYKELIEKYLICIKVFYIIKKTNWKTNSEFGKIKENMPTGIKSIYNLLNDFMHELYSKLYLNMARLSVNDQSLAKGLASLEIENNIRDLYKKYLIHLFDNNELAENLEAVFKKIVNTAHERKNKTNVFAIRSQVAVKLYNFLDILHKPHTSLRNYKIVRTNLDSLSTDKNAKNERKSNEISIYQEKKPLSIEVKINQVRRSGLQRGILGKLFH